MVFRARLRGELMGLRVRIFRADYDSEMNVFYGKNVIVVTNIEGPFKPSDDEPAALLVDGPRGTKHIRPADDGFDGVQMSGGTFAHTSDSRFGEAVGFYGAVSIHDRRETWEEYESYSR